MRRRVATLAGLFVLGLLVFGPSLATAQSPEAALFKVQVRGPDEKVVIRHSLGSATLEFTISILCKTTSAYEPCANQSQLADQDLDVTLSQPRGDQYPQGWKVEVTQASPFTMNAGDQRVVRVTVSLSTDDPARDSVQVELQATARPRSAAPLPLPGQVDSSQSTSHADSQKVEKVLTFAENVESVTRDYKVPLLGGAVVLLLGAAILARGARKKAGLALDSESPSQMVAPGRGASFPVRLSNQSREDDRFRLRTSHLPAGWVTILPLDEVELRAGEQTQLWVTLRAPTRAIPGQSLTFELRANSVKDPGQDARVSLQVTVGSSREVPVPPPPVEEPEFPEENVALDIEQPQEMPDEGPAVAIDEPDSEAPAEAEPAPKRAAKRRATTRRPAQDSDS